MFVLMCRITHPNSVVTNIAFEVHPNWSIEFMHRLALLYLDTECPGLTTDSLSLFFGKLSNYELKEEDIYVDLMYYVEEAFHAVLRYKR